MNVTELQEYFGTTEGYFYIVLKPKSSTEILQDLNTIVNTLNASNNTYIRTIEPVTHIDYELITV